MEQRRSAMQGRDQEQLVRISLDGITLDGNLTLVKGAESLVLFAHGSGSSRHSPRNRFVSQALNRAGLSTLRIDLLTSAEEAEDAYTAHLRFDISMLAERLVGTTDWLQQYTHTREQRIGYFGASTGAAAALVAAAERQDVVGAVVSRGGRPDLAGEALAHVRAPTLLIVGGADRPVITLNQQALRRLVQADKELIIVPGATHLFEEPGTLDEVARLATNWFTRHLRLEASSRHQPADAIARH